jgi:hypothetical protein
LGILAKTVKSFNGFWEKMTVKLEDLISLKEASEIRGVTIQAIMGLIERQRLKGFKVGGKTFVLRREVEKYKPGKPGRPRKKKAAQKQRRHRSS